MVNTRSEQEFNVAVQGKFEEFKEAFIKQIKSNLKEIFKDEIREIIKEALSELEKVFSTVNLIQKHVSTLKKSNIALQKNVLTLSFLLTIMSSIVAEHVLESLTYLMKKRKQMKEY